MKQYRRQRPALGLIRLVLMSAAPFRRRGRYAPRSRTIDELTDDELSMIAETRMAKEHNHLNALLDE